MVGWLIERQASPYQYSAPSDPMQILLDASEKLPPEYTAELNALLTSEEMTAVDTALATPGADEVIRKLAAAGKTLAVASNNAAEAIAEYVKRVGLATCFDSHIHGRAADPVLMKPNPDCVRRALQSTGSKPSETLMVGDSPSDFLAARSLGVGFVGFAPDERHADRLKAVGVDRVVSSWEPVLFFPRDG
jgi:HAD superfamily hydrolase (TIGR01509 family)